MAVLAVCRENETMYCISMMYSLLGGLNAVLMRRQSCVEAYAEDALLRE